MGTFIVQMELKGPLQIVQIRHAGLKTAGHGQRDVRKHLVWTFALQETVVSNHMFPDTLLKCFLLMTNLLIKLFLTMFFFF